MRSLTPPIGWEDAYKRTLQLPRWTASNIITTRNILRCNNGLKLVTPTRLADVTAVSPLPIEVEKNPSIIIRSSSAFGVGIFASPQIEPLLSCARKNYAEYHQLVAMLKAHDGAGMILTAKIWKSWPLELYMKQKQVHTGLQFEEMKPSQLQTYRENEPLVVEIHFEHSKERITWKVNDKVILKGLIPSPSPLFIVYRATGENVMEFLPFPPTTSTPKDKQRKKSKKRRGGK